MPQTHHFILVHGAYHQPAHWSPLVTLLQASGHQTSTPRLPSVSAVPIPNCLAADISSIKTSILDAIASGSDSIVPILHSYGGIPGFEAIATLTDEEKSKITRVICISAFIIPKGESLVSVQKPDSRNYVEITVSFVLFFSPLSGIKQISLIYLLNPLTATIDTNNPLFNHRAQQRPSPPQSPSSTTTSNRVPPSTPLPCSSRTS